MKKNPKGSKVRRINRAQLFQKAQALIHMLESIWQQFSGSVELRPAQAYERWPELQDWLAIFLFKQLKAKSLDLKLFTEELPELYCLEEAALKDAVLALFIESRLAPFEQLEIRFSSAGTTASATPTDAGTGNKKLSVITERFKQADNLKGFVAMHDGDRDKALASIVYAEQVLGGPTTLAKHVGFKPTKLYSWKTQLQHQQKKAKAKPRTVRSKKVVQKKRPAGGQRKFNVRPGSQAELIVKALKTKAEAMRRLKAAGSAAALAREIDSRITGVNMASSLVRLYGIHPAEVFGGKRSAKKGAAKKGVGKSKPVTGAKLTPGAATPIDYKTLKGVSSYDEILERCGGSAAVALATIEAGKAAKGVGTYSKLRDLLGIARSSWSRYLMRLRADAATAQPVDTGKTETKKPAATVDHTKFQGAKNYKALLELYGTAANVLAAIKAGKKAHGGRLKAFADWAGIPIMTMYLHIKRMEEIAGMTLEEVKIGEGDEATGDGGPEQSGTDLGKSRGVTAEVLKELGDKESAKKRLIAAGSVRKLTAELNAKGIAVTDANMSLIFSAKYDLKPKKILSGDVGPTPPTPPPDGQFDSSRFETDFQGYAAASELSQSVCRAIIALARKQRVNSVIELFKKAERGDNRDVTAAATLFIDAGIISSASVPQSTYLTLKSRFASSK